jgi:FRG domain
VPPDQMAKLYPGVQMPTHADIEGVVSDDEILIKWKTDIGTNGEGKLSKSKAHTITGLKPLPNVQSWSDFKTFVPTYEPYRYAFRGHEDSTWRLRTSFHRTGRASLERFITQDLPALHRHLSGLTSHRFDLLRSDDYPSFLNLVQHHGYPTPLLDWTFSPFVAAYFAFKDLRRDKLEPDQKVRILIFDTRAWNAIPGNRVSVLMPGYLHVTMLEPLATDNPRVLPQQSISMVTNVDDIEQHIALTESMNQVSCLQAVDIPASERRAVMQDLARMGITAGSLFPGLDGACLQLKERFFDL